MNTENRNATEDLRDALVNGRVAKSLDQAAAWLRRNGYGALEATKALRSAFRVSLSVAKDVIMTHPSWKDVASDAGALQAAAIEAALASGGEWAPEDPDE